MAAMMSFDLDDTGKIDLSAIYDQADPRPFYQTLSKLDYQIPDVAAPLFRAVLEARRKSRQRQQAKIIDIGSSYGVNSAILRHGTELSDLIQMYSRETTSDLTRSQLVTRDRRMFSDLRADKSLSTIGLDVAGEAVGYAEEVGIIDGSVTTNLEVQNPTIEDQEHLADADIAISTGAIGYVGVPTFSRILDCTRASPWFALFTLRMFPVDAIAGELKRHDYLMYRLPGQSFLQRRFASKDESQEVLSKLAEMGIDPTEHEAKGWYHAEFYFARHAEETGPLPIQGLIPVTGA